VPVAGRDDLAKLTSSFNTMASQLGESIEQQRRFVADVAHDLRTPLAAMVAAAETVERGDPDTGPRAAQLLGDQTRRLARLVTDLLEMSRFDAGAVELRPEPVDLAALWTSDVVPRVAGDPVVIGDLARLHTITRNLLTNAARHGAEPVTVTIDGSRPDQVVVRVADSGSGVPDDLLPLVFDRFTRGDRARGATEGSGLGLAIAKENAVLHGGTLTVHNDGGAVFTLTLPRGHV
jgi:two-component system sensor histidine kinase MtrB